MVLKYLTRGVGPVLFISMVFYMWMIQWSIETYVPKQTILNSEMNRAVIENQTDISSTESAIDGVNWTKGDATIILNNNILLEKDITLEQCQIFMANISRFTQVGCMVARSVMEYQCDMLQLCTNEKHKQNRNLPICPCFPQNLVGYLPMDVEVLRKKSWRKLNAGFPQVAAGGFWTPKNCVPRRRVAVIIPFRDRQRHLRAFLAHVHPIFQRQLIEYRIFVIEQNMPYRFNKATLMNIGYLEAQKIFQMDCVLFHDVDTLIERDDNMVICGDKPIHYAAYTDRHKYREIVRLFGSATLLTPKDFEAANGYSNLYYGWGAEDDDFKNRLVAKNLMIYKAPVNISRCTLLKHERDVLFTTTKYSRSMSIFRYAARRNYWYDVDGLNSVRYSVVSQVDYPLYTWIHVNLQLPHIPDHTIQGMKQIRISDGIARQMLRNTVSALSVTSKYKESGGRCEVDHRTTETMPYSRVTCRYACDMQRKCKAFEYHPASSTTDEHCYLINYLKLCDMTNSTRSEVHVKL